MTNRAVSVAGLQTLGAGLSLEVAHEADELGYSTVWVAEANAAEGLSLLGAISQVAPRVGIGISSPAVAGQWHGAGYTDRPIAQVREFLTLLRECLSGETVTFQGDFY